MIASATEIVHALGLSPFLVGRSHECDYPESVKSLPVCTSPRFPVNGDSREIDRLVKETLTQAVSVYEVFGDVIERLAPTHIITQTQCEVCAVSLRDVELALTARFPFSPKVVALEPNALADIWDDISRVAAACGVEDAGARLIADLQSRMRVIAGRAQASADRPAVACIEWPEPLMAAGNWIPELVEMAGGLNLFGKAGKHSPWMTWQSLAAADPDVIVSMPCGYNLDQTRREMHWLTEREGWSELKAVREGRVYLADGNQYFNRPGPRLVESLQILAEMLHPDRFEPSLLPQAWQHL